MKSIIPSTCYILLLLTIIATLIALPACGSKSEVSYTPVLSPTTISAGWPLHLSGSQKYDMTEDEFQDGALHHSVAYTDSSGTWTGLALWRLVGWVDDNLSHGSEAYNDDLADNGYSIKVSSADGNHYTFDSISVKRNNNIIVADKLNGKLLPETGPANPAVHWYPLRLVGTDLEVDQEIGAIIKIELLNLLTPVPTPTQSPTTSEVEAVEFQGVKLTPIKEQRNNALSGTQIIDKNSYTLTVDGLADHALTLSYTDLLSYPQESWLMDLNCVEGWSFTAKWTGPRLEDILNDAKVKSDARIVIFYTADDPRGYTSLELSYIYDNDIILAMKLNDVTLPPDRGFPFQVVAKSKYGYKWAKWVTRIELSSDIGFRGYWESMGFNNTADVKGPAFD